ncbi:MAG: ribosome-associated translation inhibitor RaiA [Candidatus Paceibacterota bacterium]|jgi:ribosomal subunit interface protein
MKKTIKATNIELTDAIGTYIDKILAAIEKHVDQDDTSVLADIEVGKTTHHHKSGDIFRAEVNLHTRIGTFRAVSETGDLYAAIDDVKDEISAALKSKKERKTDFVRRGGLAFKNMIRGIYEKGRGRWKK